LLHFALLVPSYLLSPLVYLILRALSPIKVYDRKTNISSPFHRLGSIRKALNCRASYERKDKLSRTTTPTTLERLCAYMTAR
jgi:hypothetical protein